MKGRVLLVKGRVMIFVRRKGRVLLLVLLLVLPRPAFAQPRDTPRADAPPKHLEYKVSGPSTARLRGSRAGTPRDPTTPSKYMYDFS